MKGAAVYELARELAQRRRKLTCERCSRVFGRTMDLGNHLRRCGVESPPRRGARPTSPRPVTIYIITTTEGPPRVKIGFTTRVLGIRLAELQLWSPVRLEIRSAWEATTGDEWDLHDELVHLRLHGEWFEGAAADKAEAILGGRLSRVRVAR